MNPLLKVIFIVSFLLVGLIIQGQTYYTVCAESGLTLRKGPDVNAEKIQIVPYFHKVEFIQLHRDKTLQVDDVNGFWVEVKYNNEVGFMFSGYLVPRSYGPHEKDARFVFLDEYEEEHESVENGTKGKLDFTKYVPGLSWYGVRVSSHNTTIREVRMQLDINPHAIQKLYNHMDEVYKTPLQDSIAQLVLLEADNEYNFFIGSKRDLASLVSSKRYEEGNEGTPGTFIYPFQPIRLLDGQNLQSEIITNQIDCSTTYELFILNNQYQKILDFEWGSGRKRSIRDHLLYQSPRLVWEGDINYDGTNDLMFYVSPMEDKCVRNYHMIYVSEMNDSGEINFEPYYGVNLSSMNYY